MINKFLSFVDSNNIAIKNSKILLAISGGIDSVVLAYIFKKLDVNFGLAHCNFCLRGKESDEDEQFVKALAKNLSVKVYTISFNTEKVAKSKGVSIQMAARDLRYSWFDKIRKEFNYDFIATAHHKGDIVETILFNLAKGCGLEGLHGIKPVMGNIIRPLLFAERNEIGLFAKKHNIGWREDSSNKSVKYSRNKIRHQVIPILEELNPKAQESICSTSKRIKEAEQFMSFTIEKLVKTLVNKQEENTSVDIKRLITIPGYKYVLHKILKTFGFNFSQVDSISEALNGISGKLFYSATHVANIDRKVLLISPLLGVQKTAWLQNAEEELVLNSVKLSTRFFSREKYAIINSKQILALDKSKLKFPLEIRSWQKGDVFYPLGMVGKKKVSDFMIDAKIPVNLKDQIRVVVSEEAIVGILNHRLDRRFKIDDNTKTVFEITSK